MEHEYEIDPRLIMSHWEMLDALSSEILIHRRWEVSMKGTIFADILSRAARDPRFEAVGFYYSDRGQYIYRSPLGVVYKAIDGAAAAFLGLPMKSPSNYRTADGKDVWHHKRGARAAELVIFREDDYIELCHNWLRWKVQKMRGYTDKDKDFCTGYEINKPKDFPDTLKLINELYPQKDSEL